MTTADLLKLVEDWIVGQEEEEEEHWHITRLELADAFRDAGREKAAKCIDVIDAPPRELDELVWGIRQELYPDGYAGAEWTPCTISAVAEMLENYGFGPEWGGLE
jgi:hypothetical protein